MVCARTWASGAKPRCNRQGQGQGQGPGVKERLRLPRNCRTECMIPRPTGKSLCGPARRDRPRGTTLVAVQTSETGCLPSTETSPVSPGTRSGQRRCDFQADRFLDLEKETRKTGDEKRLIRCHVNPFSPFFDIDMREVLETD